MVELEAAASARKLGTVHLKGLCEVPSCEAMLLLVAIGIANAIPHTHTVPPEHSTQFRV